MPFFLVTGLIMEGFRKEDLYSRTYFIISISYYFRKKTVQISIPDLVLKLYMCIMYKGLPTSHKAFVNHNYIKIVLIFNFD